LCELNVYNSRRKFILAEKTRSAFINNWRLAAKVSLPKMPHKNFEIIFLSI
jgi:hypothetical protein